MISNFLTLETTVKSLGRICNLSFVKEAVINITSKISPLFE